LIKPRDDYSNYSNTELKRRIWDLEKAVWQLQQRVFQLELGASKPIAAPPEET